MLLLDTLPMLGNVLLLCFFVFFIFGIVGVQLWAGFPSSLASSDSHKSPLFVFTPELQCPTNLWLLQVFCGSGAISTRRTNAISLVLKASKSENSLLDSFGWNLIFLSLSASPTSTTRWTMIIHCRTTFVQHLTVLVLKVYRQVINFYPNVYYQGCTSATTYHVTKKTQRWGHLINVEDDTAVASLKY